MLTVLPLQSGQELGLERCASGRGDQKTGAQNQNPEEAACRWPGGGCLTRRPRRAVVFEHLAAMGAGMAARVIDLTFARFLH